MKKLFKALFKSNKQEKQSQENYFRSIPERASKTWKHFDRFNVELYHDYLIKINEQ